jgi:hypothetical protein
MNQKEVNMRQKTSIKTKNKRNEKKKLQPAKLRNPMIIAAFKKEINIQTNTEEDRTKYKRKPKHKQSYSSKGFEDSHRKTS